MTPLRWLQRVIAKAPTPTNMCYLGKLSFLALKFLFPRFTSKDSTYLLFATSAVEAIPVAINALIEWQIFLNISSYFFIVLSFLRCKFFKLCNPLKIVCIPAVHIISFCVSFLSRVDEPNKLAGLQCMGLHSSGW